MAQHTINIPCIADTYVNKNSPNSNYGTSTTLKLGGYVNEHPYVIYCGLFKFDFSQVPIGKNIVGATVYLYSRNAPPNGGSIIYEPLSTIFYEYSTTFNSINIYGGLGVDNFNVTSNAWKAIPISSHYMRNSQYLLYLINNGIQIKRNDTSNPGVYWEVDSRDGSNPPYLEVLYEDVPPSKPIINTPIGTLKGNNTIITFSWSYTSTVGGEQKAFDLQWSTDQVSWNTVSQTSSNTYYDMPAGTLPGGNIYWRVQTYNQYDEASGYSDVAAFYSIGSPDAPIIYNIATGSSRPVISWTSSSQEVYQLEIIKNNICIYDSGYVPQKSYSHQVTSFLEDGLHIAKVRVQNEYGLWSDYAKTEFQVSTIKPSKPVVTVLLCDNCVKANVTNFDDSDYLLLMRALSGSNDYIAVDKSTGSSLFDYTCASNSQYLYKVRAVSNSDTFCDSDPILITPSVKGNAFSPISNLSRIITLTHNIEKQPEKNLRLNHITNMFYCVGRKYPIFEKTEHLDSGMNFTFALQTYDQLLEFIKLFNKGETVLWRDYSGRKMYGILTNLGIIDSNRFYVISFTLNEVDHSEGMAYDK